MLRLRESDEVGNLELSPGNVEGELLSSLMRSKYQSWRQRQRCEHQKDPGGQFCRQTCEQGLITEAEDESHEGLHLGELFNRWLM